MSKWTERLAVAETGIGAYPAGLYPCQVVACRADVSKAGNDMLVIEIRITGGVAEGRKLTAYRVLPTEPKPLAYFLRGMAALGLDQAFFEQLPDDDDAAMIAGVLNGEQPTAYVKVSVSDWNGQAVNQVDGFTDQFTQ